MSLNAAALEILASKGLTASDIVAVAKALENVDTAADRRRAWDRERKREQRENDRLSGGMSGGFPPDGSPNDIDTLTPSTPFSNENADPEKILFDNGIKILTAGGSTEAKARSLLGKWKRDHGAPTVISALSAAKREGAIEPVAFVEAALKLRANQQAPPVWDGMA